jgi:hypothetical protein
MQRGGWHGMQRDIEEELKACRNLAQHCALNPLAHLSTSILDRFRFFHVCSVQDLLGTSQLLRHENSRVVKLMGGHHNYPGRKKTHQTNLDSSI